MNTKSNESVLELLQQYHKIFQYNLFNNASNNIEYDIDILENEVLKKYGLPFTSEYKYKLKTFGAIKVINNSLIKSLIKNLEFEAELFLLSSPETKINSLQKDKTLNNLAANSLPKLNYKLHFISSFLYDELWLKDKLTIKELIRQLDIYEELYQACLLDDNNESTINYTLLHYFYNNNSKYWKNLKEYNQQLKSQNVLPVINIDSKYPTQITGNKLLISNIRIIDKYDVCLDCIVQSTKRSIFIKTTIEIKTVELLIQNCTDKIFSIYIQSHINNYIRQPNSNDAEFNLLRNFKNYLFLNGRFSFRIDKKHEQYNQYKLKSVYIGNIEYLI